MLMQRLRDARNRARKEGDFDRARVFDEELRTQMRLLGLPPELLSV